MIIVRTIAILLILISVSSEAAEVTCAKQDEVCKKFELLSDMQQDEKIIELADHMAEYSDATLFYIGLAYYSIGNKYVAISSKRAEELYLKAIEFKYYKAYMGLYNVYEDKEPAKAISFIREYINTKPDDADAFFVIGKHEFAERNYRQANQLLNESKRLSKNHSAQIDWLLFQVNYILGDYKFATKMLESALAQGSFTDEVKVLKKDSRFHGIEKNPAFKEFQEWFEQKNR